MGARWIEEPLGSLGGRAVVAVAGVARPEGFLAMLARAGCTVRRTLLFPDHHAYDDRDVAGLVAAAAEGTLVTTEKDLAKLGGRPGLEELCALRVSVEVEEGEQLVGRLLA
jgi:tetraacyldisaccharide 4'-kinase